MNLPNGCDLHSTVTDSSASYDLDLGCSSHLDTWLTGNVLLIELFLFFLGVDVGAASCILFFRV